MSVTVVANTPLHPCAAQFLVMKTVKNDVFETKGLKAKPVFLFI